MFCPAPRLSPFRTRAPLALAALTLLAASPGSVGAYDPLFDHGDPLPAGAHSGSSEAPRVERADPANGGWWTGGDRAGGSSFDYVLSRFFTAEGRAPVGEFLASVADVNLELLYETDEQGRIRYDEAGSPRMLRGEAFSGDRQRWRERLRGAVEEAVSLWRSDHQARRAALYASIDAQEPVDRSPDFEARLLAEEKRRAAAYRERLESIMRLEEQRFVARRTRDQWSRRRESEEVTAEQITARIVEESEEALRDGLARLEQQFEHDEDDPGNLELEDSGWREQFRTQFDSGMRRWEAAEERLLSERIEWEREAVSDLERGEEIWADAYRRLVDARERWERELSDIIEEGTRRWTSEADELDERIGEATLEIERAIVDRKHAAHERIDTLVELWVGARDTLRTAVNSAGHWFERLDYSASDPHAIGNRDAVEDILRGELLGAIDHAFEEAYSESAKARLVGAEHALSTWQPQSLPAWHPVDPNASPPQELYDAVDEAQARLHRVRSSGEFAVSVLENHFSLETFREAIRYEGQRAVGVDPDFFAGHHEPAVNAADPALAMEMVDEALSRLSSERALGQIVFWHETSERYGEQAANAWNDLLSTYGVTLSDEPYAPAGTGGASPSLDAIVDDGDWDALYLDDYQLELLKSRANEQYWEHQLEIAQSVYDYAVDESSDRPTAAETSAAHEKALAELHRAQEAYRGGVLELEAAGEELSGSREALDTMLETMRGKQDRLSEARQAYRRLTDIHLGQDFDIYRETIGAYFAEWKEIIGDHSKAGKRENAATGRGAEWDALVAYREARSAHDAESRYEYAWRELADAAARLGEGFDVGDGVDQDEGAALFHGDSSFGGDFSAGGQLDAEAADFAPIAEELNAALERAEIRDLEARMALLSSPSLEVWLDRSGVDSGSLFENVPAVEDASEIEQAIARGELAGERSWLARRVAREREAVGLVLEFIGSEPDSSEPAASGDPGESEAGPAAHNAPGLDSTAHNAAGGSAFDEEGFHHWVQSAGVAPRVERLLHGLDASADPSSFHAELTAARDALDALSAGLSEVDPSGLFGEAGVAGGEVTGESDAPLEAGRSALAGALRPLLVTHEYAADFLHGESLFVENGRDLSRAIAEIDRGDHRDIRALRRAYERHAADAPLFAPYHAEHARSAIESVLSRHDLRVPSGEGGPSGESGPSLILRDPETIARRYASLGAQGRSEAFSKIERELRDAGRGVDSVLEGELSRWLEAVAMLASADDAADRGADYFRAEMERLDNRHAELAAQIESITAAEGDLRDPARSAAARIAGFADLLAERTNAGGTSQAHTGAIVEQIVSLVAAESASALWPDLAGLSPEAIAAIAREEATDEGTAEAKAPDEKAPLENSTEAEPGAALRSAAEREVEARLRPPGADATFEAYEGAAVDQTLSRVRLAALREQGDEVFIAGPLAWDTLNENERRAVVFSRYEAYDPGALLGPVSARAREIEWDEVKPGDSHLEVTRITASFDPLFELLPVERIAVFDRIDPAFSEPYYRVLSLALSLALADSLAVEPDEPLSAHVGEALEIAFENAGLDFDRLDRGAAADYGSGLNADHRSGDGHQIRYIYSGSERAYLFAAGDGGRKTRSWDRPALSAEAVDLLEQRVNPDHLLGYASWLDGSTGTYALEVSESFEEAVELASALAGTRKLGGYAFGAPAADAARLLSFERHGETRAVDSIIDFSIRYLENQRSEHFDALSALEFERYLAAENGDAAQKREQGDLPAAFFLNEHYLGTHVADTSGTGAQSGIDRPWIDGQQDAAERVARNSGERIETLIAGASDRSISSNRAAMARWFDTLEGQSISDRVTSALAEVAGEIAVEADTALTVESAFDAHAELRAREQWLSGEVSKLGNEVRRAQKHIEREFEDASAPLAGEIEEREREIEDLDAHIAAAVDRFERANDAYAVASTRVSATNSSVERKTHELQRAEAILDYASSGYVGAESGARDEGLGAVDPRDRLDRARARYDTARLGRVALESVQEGDRDNPVEIDAGRHREIEAYQTAYERYREYYRDRLALEALETLLGDALVRQEQIVEERFRALNTTLEQILAPAYELPESVWLDYIEIAPTDGSTDGRVLAGTRLSLTGSEEDAVDAYFTGEFVSPRQSDDRRKVAFERDRHEWMLRTEKLIGRRGESLLADWGLAIYHRDLSLLEAIELHFEEPPDHAGSDERIIEEFSERQRTAREHIAGRLNIDTRVRDYEEELSTLHAAISEGLEPPDSMVYDGVAEYLDGTLFRRRIRFDEHLRSSAEAAWERVEGDSESRELFEFYATMHRLGVTPDAQSAGVLEEHAEGELAEFIAGELSALKSDYERMQNRERVAGVGFYAAAIAMLPWAPAGAVVSFGLAATSFAVAASHGYTARRASEVRSDTRRQHGAAAEAARASRRAIAEGGSAYRRGYRELAAERERLATLRGEDEDRDSPMSVESLVESLTLSAEVLDLDLFEYAGDERLASGGLAALLDRHLDSADHAERDSSHRFTRALNTGSERARKHAEIALEHETQKLGERNRMARETFRRRQEQFLDAPVDQPQIDELSRLAESAFGGALFTEREHERSVLSLHYGAHEGYDTDRFAGLEGFDRSFAARVRGDLKRMTEGRYAAYATAREQEFAAMRRNLALRRGDWQDTVSAVTSRGRRQWAESERRLNDRRARWITGTGERYERGLETWNTQYTSLAERRAEWVEGAAGLAAQVGSATALAAVGDNAEAAIAQSTNAVVPLPSQLSNLDAEEIVGEALGGYRFERLLSIGSASNRSIARGVPNIMSSLGANPWYDASVGEQLRRARRGEQGATEQAIHLIVADRARERFSEIAATVADEVESANEQVESGTDRTFRDAGWEIRGSRFRRNTVVADTLLSGVIRNRHTVDRYRHFDDYDFSLETDLSVETLARMSSGGIDAQVTAAVVELQRELERVFGTDSEREAGPTVVAEAGERRSVSIDRGWFASTFDIGESSVRVKRHSDALLQPGLFGEHVGYAPQLTPEVDFDRGWQRNALFPGSGQMHRLMGQYRYYEAMQAKGYGELNAAIHNTPIWDGDYAPTIRSIADVGAGVAATLASGGLAGAAISAGNAALWGAADVASGDATAAGALLGTAQAAAFSGITDLAGLAGHAVGEGVTGALGSRAVGSAAGNLSEAALSSVAGGAVGAIHENRGGLDFSERAFLERSAGTTALAGYAGSAAGGATAGAIAAANTVELRGFDVHDSLERLNLSVDRTAALAGGAVDQTIRYGVSGAARVNIANLEDIGRGLSALGATPSLLTDDRGSLHRHGLLELGVGGNGVSLRLGTGGMNLSASHLAGVRREAANFGRIAEVQNDVNAASDIRDWMLGQSTVIEQSVSNIDGTSELLPALRADLEQSRSRASIENLFGQARARSTRPAPEGYRYDRDEWSEDLHLDRELRRAREQGDIAASTFLSNASLFDIQAGAEWGLELYHGGHLESERMFSSGLAYAGAESRGSESFGMRTALFAEHFSEDAAVAELLLDGGVFDSSEFIERSVGLNRMRSIGDTIATVAEGHEALESMLDVLREVQTAIHGSDGTLMRSGRLGSRDGLIIEAVNEELFDRRSGSAFFDTLARLNETDGIYNYEAPTAGENVQYRHLDPDGMTYAPSANIPDSGSARMTSDYALRAMADHAIVGQHLAVDFSLRGGPSFFSTLDGEIGMQWDRRNTVGLTTRVDYGDGNVGIYGHASPESLYDVARAVLAAGGTEVPAGTVIGRSEPGTWSGLGSGAHLDYQIRNPESYEIGETADPALFHSWDEWFDYRQPRHSAGYVEAPFREYSYRIEETRRALITALNIQHHLASPVPSRLHPNVEDMWPDNEEWNETLDWFRESVDTPLTR